MDEIQHLNALMEEQRKLVIDVTKKQEEEINDIQHVKALLEKERQKSVQMNVVMEENKRLQGLLKEQKVKLDEVQREIGRFKDLHKSQQNLMKEEQEEIQRLRDSLKEQTNLAETLQREKNGLEMETYSKDIEVRRMLSAHSKEVEAVNARLRGKQPEQEKVRFRSNAKKQQECPERRALDVPKQEKFRSNAPRGDEYADMEQTLSIHREWFESTLSDCNRYKC